MNLRPSGYEPDELPTAPPRDVAITYVAISHNPLDKKYSTTTFGICQAFFYFFLKLVEIPINLLYNSIADVKF